MSDFNANVIEEFRANAGKVGGPFEGAPMMLVHHLGAKSGTERVAPLIHFPQDDGTTLVVASKGGAPTNPDWYHNLVAHPKVQVELGTQTVTMEATELSREERDQVWPSITTSRPQFADYQRTTDRVIPVLRLREV